MFAGFARKYMTEKYGIHESIRIHTYCVDSVLVCQHSYNFRLSLHARENLKASSGNSQCLAVAGSHCSTCPEGKGVSSIQATRQMQ